MRSLFITQYRRLQYRIRPWIRLANRHRSLSYFLIIHIVFCILWLFVYGFWTRDKAYPKTRTQLILVVHSSFIWAIVMLSAPFVEPLISTTRHGGDGHHFLRRLDDASPAVKVDEEDDFFQDQGPQFKTFMDTFRHPKALLYWSFILLYLVLATTYENPGDHRYRSVVETAHRLRKPSGFGRGDKILIAALFYNNQQILPHWSREIIKVAHYIGTDNVFISIVESNSIDRTPKLLAEFQEKLVANGIPHRVLIQDTSIAPPMRSILDSRVKFLTDSRNLALAPLTEEGGHYDWVLFSNDVFVEAESVVELLNTRGGDYDMVCGTDTGKWGLYDAWVIRDRHGELVSSLWPYFLEETAQRAVWWEEPAPVFSCWGGISVFRADPLLPVDMRKSGRLSTVPLPQPLPSSHPAYSADNQNLTSPALTPPIKFRVSSPDECLSSECFLLPYDFRRQFLLDKIYMNPRVIVGYTWMHYFWYKYVTRHWLVMWWMRNVERADEGSMKAARMVLGKLERAYDWDGGKCMKVKGFPLDRFEDCRHVD